jgi:hypothetical protein
VAKKNPKNVERRAMVEKMRQEQARKERMRSMTILGISVLVVVGLLVAALIPYLNDRREKNEIANTKVENLGSKASAASCDDVITEVPEGTEASGTPGNHVDAGTKIDYAYAPPAFGPHWGNFLTGPEIRSFYTPDDRPELERMVHSLEHGHTFIWYDETVKAGSQAYEDLEAIAEKYSDSTTYVNIVPWKSTDGDPFPDGKHVAMSHWTADGDKQTGVWQYCAEPSGEAIKSFVTEYPATNAPEPGGA